MPHDNPQLQHGLSGVSLRGQETPGSTKVWKCCFSGIPKDAFLPLQCREVMSVWAPKCVCV